MKRIGLATRETFASMRVRNFRLFFAGQLVSQVGNWLTLIAQTLLVFELTHSGVALGLLAAAQFGPVLMLGPWAGLVADRSDKRKLLLIVQVIAMAQSFALAALAFSGHPSVLAIYAIAFVGGVTVAFDNPARRAFVVEMVPESGITNAVSLNSALDDLRPHGRPGPGRPAGHHRRLRLVLRRRRPLLHRRHRRAVADPHLRAAAVAGGRAGQGPGARRACATPAACPSCGCRWS